MHTARFAGKLLLDSLNPSIQVLIDLQHFAALSARAKTLLIEPLNKKLASCSLGQAEHILTFDAFKLKDRACILMCASRLVARNAISFKRAICNAFAVGKVDDGVVSELTNFRPHFV